jgi:predicted amidohydrolase
MARRVTLSAIQPEWPRHDPSLSPQEMKQRNIDDAIRWLEEAGRRGTDIACLPETFTDNGIPARRLTASEVDALVEDLRGPTVQRLAAVARRYRMHVVAPMHRREGNAIYNSAVVIDRAGKVAGVYDKVHPTRAEMEGPYRVQPGAAFNVIRLDFGTIGIMICHDNSFVESARCLALNGAEIIFWPHVQSGWGDIVWDITLRSRAIDNGVWLVSSCYSVRGTGAWKPGMMVGRSGIVGQDGFILAEMGRDPGVATCTVDLDDLRQVHSWSREGEFPYRYEYLKDRRPDAYAPITRPKEQGAPQEASAVPAGVDAT